uniref:Uncharacterized protein n=1 Tax=Timema bartmani TaxID=61472 RepID=A0A7R9F955_9NEOP|nr:unnamed protein product [Timema bartmani]
MLSVFDTCGIVLPKAIPTFQSRVSPWKIRLPQCHFDLAKFSKATTPYIVYMDCVMIRGRRGTLHFVRFPTSEMGNFLVLAKSKGMATLVTTVFATGGGAFKFEDNFQTRAKEFYSGCTQRIMGRKEGGANPITRLRQRPNPCGPKIYTKWDISQEIVFTRCEQKPLLKQEVQEELGNARVPNFDSHCGYKVYYR